MNFAKGFTIHSSNDIQQRNLLTCHFTLNHGRNIHILKHQQVPPALAICLYSLVLIDGFAHTTDDEGRERQCLSGADFLLSQERTSLCHVDLQ